jgi:hypothetical protein
MNKWLLLLPLVLLLACGDKKEEQETADNSAFLPVASILRGQIKDVDTSLYNIMKIETKNNVPETTHIRRDEFKKYAADFLALPDLTQKKWKGDYEEANYFDASLESFIHSYTARDEDLETRKQEVLTTQTPDGELHIKTIMADTFKEEKGETIRKNMIWHLDKRFQVITTRQKKNGTEEVEKLQVIWNWL